MAAQISSSLFCYSSVRETTAAQTAFLPRKFSSFLIEKPLYRRSIEYKSKSGAVRCEQRSSNASDVWLGRLAMIGFASGIGVEIATGKGFLQNFGVATPLPTVALAVTVLVVVLTAVFIFQSASEN